MKASFRGVPFYIETAELGGGRKGVTHEYPLRDASFRQDLGRAVRKYPVEGHVIGADSARQQKALQDALELEGPGELVHPAYGTKRVAVTSFRFRTRTDEMRIVRFSIEFEETDVQPSSPTAVPDPQATVDASVEAAREAAYAAFTAKYRVTGQPQWAFAGLAGVLSSAGEAMDTLLGPVVSTVQDTALLKRKTDALISDADDLVHAPEDVLTSVADLFTSLDDIPLTPFFGLQRLMSLVDFDPGERPSTSTPTREQQRENFDALRDLLRRMTIIQAAKAAPSETFESYEDAITVRDQIADALDDQAGDDDAYSSLMELRSNVVNSVPGTDADLPHILTHTPTETVPSLVLAYRLYGSTDMEADLIARNSVAHPGFIIGGRALKVLSED